MGYQPKFDISASHQKGAPPRTLFYGEVMRQQRMYSFGRIQSRGSDYLLTQALRIDHRNGW